MFGLNRSNIGVRDWHSLMQQLERLAGVVAVANRQYSAALWAGDLSNEALALGDKAAIAESAFYKVAPSNVRNEIEEKIQEFQNTWSSRVSLSMTDAQARAFGDAEAWEHITAWLCVNH